MPISSWDLLPRRYGTFAGRFGHGDGNPDLGTTADPANVQGLDAGHAHGYAQP